jgi:hypothetical protein
MNRPTGIYDGRLRLVIVSHLVTLAAATLATTVSALSCKRLLEGELDINGSQR